MKNNSEAYLSFNRTRKIPTAILEYLFTNSQDIWKLLKYEVAPLSYKDLTLEEKREMVARSSLEGKNKNVIMQRFYPEAQTDANAQIRMEILKARPMDGRTTGICTILIQVVVPNETMIVATDETPYDNRAMAITQELIELLNGEELDEDEGIGYLYLDSNLDGTTGVYAVTFNEKYSGYELTMNCNIYG